MERTDEYRSLKEKLLRLSQNGFEGKSSISDLLDVLKKIGDLKIRNVSRWCMDLYELVPKLRKNYLNIDSGDIAFLEDDWDYAEIKRRFDILAAKLSKEV